MARAKPTDSDPGEVLDYRHDRARRKNNPPAGLASQGRIAERPVERYSYNPHLPPVLRFDVTGAADRYPPLLEAARRRPLTADEVDLLARALRTQEPWIEWAGKREKKHFEVDPVALHIHERVSTKAILAVAARQDVQRSFFADPQLEYRQAVQFYQHDVDWANRLILGDSLAVMSSLAKRESLAGQVQMIYVDPPYGIKFASNFQSQVGQRDVKDRPEDLTREPEVVKAYRDTWTLGVHSYLGYLRDRLLVAKELLSDSGSIFVQIGDGNIHRVRAVMDEVFGNDNFCSQITLWKTSGATTVGLPAVSDYLLWYAKDKTRCKYRQLFTSKDIGDTDAAEYAFIELPDAIRRPMTEAEFQRPASLPAGSKAYRPSPMTSQSASATTIVEFEFEGSTFRPRSGGWKTNLQGFQRLANAGRIVRRDKSLSYVRYLDDFPVVPVSNLWLDTRWGFDAGQRTYVVQTNVRVVQRCLLMTTDPGDLVLDPTCGSGTTAYVAEQWGRRWITVDTSRVAIALARQRLLTATFEYYKLRDEEAGPAGGFRYKTVPHITLKSIAQNVALDPIYARHEPVLAEKLADLNSALARVSSDVRAALTRKLVRKEQAEGRRAITDADRRRWLLPKDTWQVWEVPFDADPDWPQPLQDALIAYRGAWRAKMDEVSACIAASAEREELVDQPEVARGVVRVAGPFTVESVLPPEQQLDLEPSPIDEPEEELPTFADASPPRPVPDAETRGPGDPETLPASPRLRVPISGGKGGAEAEPANAEAYLEQMIRLLRADGVRFPDNKQVRFARLDPIEGSILHAEGEWAADDGQARRVAVSFGPQYGPVTARQVEDCLRAAYRRGYDELVFAGFSFDAAAQAAIQEDENPRLRAHLAHIRPDVTMGNLLKETPNSQLFTVFGLPRTRLDQMPDGQWRVIMEGVDVYDPVTNTVASTGASKVAAWFLDADYDGRTFCICQAFFPDSSAWDKLTRALKGVVDPDAFARFGGTTSLPFPGGQHRRVAVKVIDPRGNEVLRVHPLSRETIYA